MAKKNDSTSTVLNGMRKGEATSVAMIEDPAGKYCINGCAKASKIAFANGNSATNMSITAMRLRINL